MASFKQATTGGTIIVRNPFSPGDHVSTLCFGGAAFHHAIYEKEDENGRAVLIHFVPTNVNLGGTKGQIRRTNVNALDYKLVYRPPNPRKVLERAKAMALAEVGNYNILWFNCEHFTNWCVTGTEHSKQITNITLVMGGLLVSGVVGRVAEVAAVLGPPIAQEISYWWRGVQSAEQCCVGIMRHLVSERSVSLAGGMAAGFAGSALGTSVAGPAGSVAGFVAGVLIGSEVAKRIFRYLREKLILDEPELALERAYGTIGVPRHTSAAEIERAYRKLAKIHHPDHGGKKEKFVEIATAIEMIRHALRSAEEHASVSKTRDDTQRFWKEAENRTEACLEKVLAAEGNLQKAERACEGTEKECTSIQQDWIKVSWQVVRLLKQMDGYLSDQHQAKLREIEWEQKRQDAESDEQTAIAFCDDVMSYKEQLEVEMEDLLGHKAEIKDLSPARSNAKRDLKRKLQNVERKIDFLSRKIKGASGLIRKTARRRQAAENVLAKATTELRKARGLLADGREQLEPLENAKVETEQHREELKENFNASELRRVEAETNRALAENHLKVAKAELERQSEQLDEAQCRTRGVNEEQERVNRDWGITARQKELVERSAKMSERLRELADNRREAIIKKSMPLASSKTETARNDRLAAVQHEQVAASIRSNAEHERIKQEQIHNDKLAERRNKEISDEDEAGRRGDRSRQLRQEDFGRLDQELMSLDEDPVEAQCGCVIS